MAQRDLNAASPLESLATELESALARFEGTWQRGETPAIDDFLARFPPRERLGLFELVGNVREWCHDYRLAQPMDTTPVSLSQRIQQSGDAVARRRLVDLTTPDLFMDAAGGSSRG
jgi:formylglycine-generating enzyme required for sulfatase activity